MIIVLKKSATEQQVDHVVKSIRDAGLKANVSRGAERTVVGVIGDEATIASRPFDALPGVESVMRVQKPYKLASSGIPGAEEPRHGAGRRHGDQPVIIGDGAVVVVAGPCSVEPFDIMVETADFIKKAGARLMRAGAFKPRTSPYAFQGLGVEGLRILAKVRDATGLPIVTEVMDTRDVEMVAEVADVLQIGAATCRITTF